MDADQATEAMIAQAEEASRLVQRGGSMLVTGSRRSEEAEAKRSNEKTQMEQRDIKVESLFEEGADWAPRFLYMAHTYTKWANAQCMAFH